MSIIYVRSTDGSDSDNGSTWALAKATLAGAAAIAVAGDTIYVSHQHAETQASAMAISLPGTEVSPVRVICVNDGAEPPTASATTATVSTTGANGLNIAAANGCFYVYGITFSSGAHISVQHTSSGSGRVVYESCNFILNNATGSSVIQYGAGSGQVNCRFINCNCTFGHASQMLQSWIGDLDWTGGAIAGTAPTTLFQYVYGTHVNCRGVDLSLLGSGKSLGLLGTPSYETVYTFIDCKLGSSVSLTSNNPSHKSWAKIVNSDSGDTNYRYQKTVYEGSVYSESTIVRTGGASDGTTAISRKMVSSADSEYFAPLESDPIIVWNETTGSSLTATVEVITDNVTLTNAEAWLEVEYLGTSGFPKGSLATDRSASLVATAANQTTSTETWTTTGLTTPVKQKLEVSFTPQEKGLVRCKVMLAKPSTTMYFCPKVSIA